MRRKIYVASSGRNEHYPEPVLRALWGLCFSPETRDTMALNAENVAKAQYPESADKIRRIYEAATANGFTSFAEA